jgi:nucleoside diphosphate kinase
LVDFRLRLVRVEHLLLLTSKLSLFTVLPTSRYIMIKPDGVQRGLVGEIIKRFETKGYVLTAMKMQQATQAQMEEHYSDLKSKGFFGGLVQYMISGPGALSVLLDCAP